MPQGKVAVDAKIAAALASREVDYDMNGNRKKVRKKVFVDGRPVLVLVLFCSY